MTSDRSQSRFWRGWEILTRSASLIRDDEGTGYYSLIEFSDGSHYPFPLLSRPLKVLATTLKIVGHRGYDWYFKCPVCGAQSFYTFKGTYCFNCSAYTDENGSVTYSRVDLYTAIVEELEREFDSTLRSIPHWESVVESEADYARVDPEQAANNF